MKNFGSKALILSIVVMFAAGCLNPRPRLTKHYKSATFGVYTNGNVRFSTFSLQPQSESARTTLLNLSERGQAAFIESIAVKTDTAKSLIQSMATPIEASPQAFDLIDRTKIKRRLVFSLEHRPAKPADRMAECTVHVAINGGKFSNWNQFVSRYETVDLGSIKATQTRELTQSIKLAPPQVKEIAEINAGAKQGSSLEEALQLQRRYVVSSGVLLPGEASLMQQGALGVDLTGNFSIDFEIAVPEKPVRPPVFYFENLRNVAGQLSLLDDIRIRKANIIVPDRSAGPVTVTCSVDFKVREALKGAETIAEGDDRVVFSSGSVFLPAQDVVGMNELQTRVFVIKPAPIDEIIQIQDVAGSNGESLFFFDLKNAEAFVDALKDHLADDAPPANPIKINKRPLVVPNPGGGSVPLKWGDVQNIIVEGYNLN